MLVRYFLIDERGDFLGFENKKLLKRDMWEPLDKTKNYDRLVKEL